MVATGEMKAAYEIIYALMQYDRLTDDDIGLGELTKYVYKKKKAVARPPYSLCLHMCK